MQNPHLCYDTDPGSAFKDEDNWAPILHYLLGLEYGA